MPWSFVTCLYTFTDIVTCNFSPTELDALVFGHVFTLLTTSLPEGRFAEIIQKFPNLTSFCQRIEEKFFRPKVPAVKS